MFHYLEDKEFEHRMRRLCGEIMQELCRTLREDYAIGASFYLVGSGARNLIMQNGAEPVDLDYNLEIVRCADFNDCKAIKTAVKNAFNKVLRNYKLNDCDDSTSALTTKKIYFTSGTSTEFSMDVCIVVMNDQGNYERLIHEKTGWTGWDRYYWNEAPNSAHTKEKADYIKSQSCWTLVREQYADIKNHYLRLGDHNHPSFICYVEAVNNVYDQIKMKRRR